MILFLVQAQLGTKVSIREHYMSTQLCMAQETPCIYARVNICERMKATV